LCRQNCAVCHQAQRVTRCARLYHQPAAALRGFQDIEQALKKDGWIEDRISGSHHIMVKDSTSIAVPVHGNEDLKKGLLNSLLKQAGYK
jgi:predicted RNA binding protein YcfA (HicA-like mRNA interferase family)